MCLMPRPSGAFVEQMNLSLLRSGLRPKVIEAPLPATESAQHRSMLR